MTRQWLLPPPLQRRCRARIEDPVPAGGPSLLHPHGAPMSPVLSVESVAVFYSPSDPYFRPAGVFGPGSGEVKKAAIVEFLKNAIGVGKLALDCNLVDEAVLVAGLDQAAKVVPRALKATGLWHTTYGSFYDYVHDV